MATKRRPEPPDPIFAAELRAIATDRREQEHRRVGCGLPIGANGEPVQPNETFTRNNAQGLDVRKFTSVLKPTGSAR